MNNTVKVVHIGHVPFPPEKARQAKLTPAAFYPGRWVLNLALAQKEHTPIHPEIVVKVVGRFEPFSKTVEGIPVHYVPVHWRLRSATLFWFEARALTRKVRSLDPNIVHAHGTEGGNLLAAQRTGKPVVVTFQGVFLLMNKILKPGPFARERFVAMAERIAFRKLRFGICKSEYGQKEMAALVPHAHLYSIPNTYVQPTCRPCFSKDECTLAFAGSIISRKGVHVLVAALRVLLKDFPELRLKMYGCHQNPLPGYEKDQIDSLRKLLGERLEICGIVPREQLDLGIAASRLLVAPSLEEMFGNQVVESLLVATPVVVSDDTPMAENVRRFGNGWIFQKGSSESLAETLRASLRQAYCEETARRAIQNIENYMSPRVVAERHLTVYSEVQASWNGK